MPYFFVGDSIFALNQNLIKPYSRSEHLTRDEEIYNNRISIECAFGILTSRWRIFSKPLGHSLATNELIIMATIMLHNFLITQEQDGSVDYSVFDPPGDRTNFVDEVDDRVLGNSEKQRLELLNYFKSPLGSVPWQEKCTK